eukprot:m.220831 g.220831  ORF g.220831 m.220831 type:complete len:60 (+) comp19171_c0_seq4:748-927(+)
MSRSYPAADDDALFSRIDGLVVSLRHVLWTCCPTPHCCKEFFHKKGTRDTLLMVQRCNG